MNEDIAGLLSYFKNKLSNERFITNELIRETIANDRFAAVLSEDESRQLGRHLEASFVIVQNVGDIITSECQPWVVGRKPDTDYFYWNRLRDYLLGKDVLPPNVVSTLDTVTDDILDCCGNPEVTAAWNYRGMVIGHVQSGKTTNYSALITKAADSGYKVIILLAGITNSLRSQTQQRIDEYFIGRKSVFNAAAQEPLEIRNFGGARNKDPDFGTTRDQDFNRMTAVIGAPFASLKEPKIFVIKKNKSVLENLNTWIRDQAHGHAVDYPLLLIDDEADNASINTSKDPNLSTTINTLIRELMANFTRSSYVGYTATPFANIFIEPDSTHDMESEDLFPRNFIKALDPPSNYCGAHRIFAENGDLRSESVRMISDYPDILPLKHKKDILLEILPPSLNEAIRAFVLARAIRCNRENGDRHCTMMINVSRFNDVQSGIEGLVYAYLEQLKASISVSARSARPFEDPNIQDLAATFEKEYSDCGASFTELLLVLNTAASTIRVSTVNMRGGNLNYETHKKTGLHVIAIGGLALSRGLTLEGLVTTYLLRNVGASDTLMQMARWFGYRPGYEDLCRIYLPEEAAEHYMHTNLAVEELRAEINYMKDSGLTPYDFGLKVRQSPTGIKITAANKMRSASEIKLAADLSGRFIQGHAIFNDQGLNLKHRGAISSFLCGIGAPSREAKGRPYWKNISGDKIVNLLKEFRFPEKVINLTHISGTSSLLGDYISDRLSGELSEWDVAIASRKKGEAGIPPVENLMQGRELHPSLRTAAIIEGRLYRFTGTSNSVGDQDSVKIGLDSELINQADKSNKIVGDKTNKYCRVRERPLMIIYLVAVNKTSIPGCMLEDYSVSLAFCLPPTQQLVREQTYQVNEIFRRSVIQPFEDEIDDDAEKLLEGDG
ncbi:MAG: Z1 domain-containing protein [Paracoccaceae bacterium]|nr:Z1 domain-containing protein [Paracoccaceae bacterium]